MSYGAEVTIIVEATSEAEALEIINSLKTQPGIVDVDVQDGLDEIPEDEDDDDDEVG